MNIRYRFFSVVAAVVLAGLSLPARAAEGRSPIWQPILIGAGSRPGQYFLSRDVDATGTGAPAISIVGGPGLQEVEIDLNGFTVFGDAAGGSAVINVAGLRSLTVRNGSVRHLGPFGDGISVTDVDKVVIEDVKIQDVTTGINLVRVSSFAVRRNIVLQAGFTGIFVNGFGAPRPITGVLEDNQISDADSNGIYVRNDHLGVQAVRNRVLRVPFGPGIILSQGKACLIAENTVEEARDGIVLDGLQNCKVHNNVTSFNTGHGIASVTSTNVLFLDNVSSSNAFSGIYYDGSGSLFDRNVLTANGCYGLHLLGPDNTFGRNAARFNVGACPWPCGVGPVEICAPPYGGGSAVPDLCVDAPGNTSLCDNTMPGPPQS